MLRVTLASALALLLAAPVAGAAADLPARPDLEERIARELGQGGAGTQAPSAQGAPQGGTGGNPTARLLLLPDISAVARFSAAYDSYDVETQSPRAGPFGPADQLALLFEEVELGLQSVIDPYARADLFISFHPDGVEVEEAFLTTLGLPAGLQLRAGKLFAPFGRQNQQHPHVWDFADAPLAFGRIVAAEVLSGPGADVAWLAPLPWFAELHLAAQSTRPYDDPGAEDRLTGVARLLQYVPLGSATTLGIGLSAARRDEPGGGFRDLAGIDAYLRWRPVASRGYLALQGELFARKFRDVEGGRADAGGYAQLFWRQGAYFGFGVRYDGAPTGPLFGAADVAEGTEHRYGGLATWYPSEFQRIRLQVSYDQRPGGQDGVEVLLGLEFGIGSHGAHPF